MKVFRDPVHDIISFDKVQENYILDLIDSKEMQRLRRIRQLGLSSYTYPGAEHSRFAHSLGTAFLMKRVIERLQRVRGKQEKQWLQEVFDNQDLVLCSALLHDIGHGPFSHAIEDVMGVKHEVWTMQIINNPDTEVHEILETYKPGFAKEVADVIARVHPCEMVVKLLSSQLDVDRFDYLLRDSLMTGVGYGKFDLEWMINTLTIGLVDGVPEIGLDLDKGLSIAEDFVVARYYMYKHVYFHKTTRSAEIITRKILNRAKELIINDEMECPPYLDVLFLSKPEDKEKFLPSYLELDDNILWYWFHQWVNGNDKLLSSLCDKLLNRKLLKSRDISGINVVNLLSHLKVLEKSPYGDVIAIDNPSTSSYKDPYISKRTRTETDGIEQDNEQREATEQIFLFNNSKKEFELARKSTIIFAIRDQAVEQQRLYYPAELQETVNKTFG
ncbi:MAG TPA: phosphohydrolase [Syntrophomonas sp.]|jgi:hypothetical protein|nr:phosphohydrolase [Syntrophomonas sp.]